MASTGASIGEVAFEAYREIRGAVTHDGKDMPLWEQLNDDIKKAWDDAVSTAAKAQEDSDKAQGDSE